MTTVTAIDTPSPTTVHPVWCSPAHCRTNENGEVLHQEAPCHWQATADDVTFTTHLIAGEGTYLGLTVESLAFRGNDTDVWLTLPTVQQLHAQLGAHLRRAALADGVTR